MPTGCRRPRGPGCSRPAIALGAMCGIVGYVGAAAEARSRSDVVIEGLRRLEYRGYDSAGVALRRRRRRRVATSAPASSPTCEKALADEPLPRLARPASATPAGPPTARPTDANAHPHLGGAGRVAVDPQRDHRELRRAQGRARSPRASSSQSETDTEVAAHLLAAAYAEHRRPGRGDARGRAAGSRARSRSLAVARRRSPASSSAPAATPRWSSASARARTSSAPTSPRSSGTPARRSSSARTRSSTITPRRRRRSPTSTATPAEGKRVPRRLGRRGRREGRLRQLHAQGDRRAAAGRRRHAARPHRRRRPAGPRRAADRPRTSCATSTRSSSSPAARRATPGMVAKYAIEHWTRIPCEVELAHEFRYRDPVLDRAHAGRRDLASPARRWTR